MNTAIIHDADIELTKLKTAGDLDPSVVALLALMEEMERDADAEALEMARLRHVEELARHAYAYHRRGYTDDPFHDEYWSADEMNARMDELGKALA